MVDLQKGWILPVGGAALVKYLHTANVAGLFSFSLLVLYTYSKNKYINSVFLFFSFFYGCSVGRPLSPLEYQIVTKTSLKPIYLVTNLCDSSDCSDSRNSSDISDGSVEYQL